MDIILEDNQLILYQGQVLGNDYEVRYNKRERGLTLIVDGKNLLKEDYQKVYALIYKDAVLNIKKTPTLPIVNNLKYEFVVTNSSEEERSKKVMQDFGLGNQAKLVFKSRKKQDLESYFKMNKISKYENGKVIYYMTRNGDNHNNEYILEDVRYDDLMNGLNQVMDNPEYSMDKLSEEQLANLVMDQLSQTRKKHYLETKDEHEAKNDYEKASLSATSLDDKVNTEIGIIKKNPYQDDENTYRAVEREGDNYQVVSPSVSEVVSLDQNSSDLKEEETEVRDEEKVYYLDDYTMDIYDEKGEKLGNMRDGYSVNYDNNHLIFNGKDMGSLSNINDLGKEVNKNKPKVRTLEKEDNNGVIDVKVFLLLIFIVMILLFGLYWFSR